MDSIMIRRTAPNGKVAGFDRFIGMFTSKAFAEEAEHIPILRAKLNQVLERGGRDRRIARLQGDHRRVQQFSEGRIVSRLGR